MGGTITQESGGKFANGARTGAFSMMLTNRNIEQQLNPQKGDFDKFMDFIKKQGVERSADENFKVEQVAGKWSASKVIRN